MILAWLGGAVLVGFLGINRRIGYWGAFLWSLFLSPLVGLIITLVSKDKNDHINEVNARRAQHDTLKELKKQNETSISKELSEIGELRNQGVITEEEFQIAKSKILS